MQVRLLKSTVHLAHMGSGVSPRGLVGWFVGLLVAYMHNHPPPATFAQAIIPGPSIVRQPASCRMLLFLPRVFVLEPLSLFPLPMLGVDLSFFLSFSHGFPPSLVQDRAIENRYPLHTRMGYSLPRVGSARFCPGIRDSGVQESTCALNYFGDLLQAGWRSATGS